MFLAAALWRACPAGRACSVADERLYFNPSRRPVGALFQPVCGKAAAGGLIDNVALSHYVETGRIVRSGGADARLVMAATKARPAGRLAAKACGEMYVWVFGEKPLRVW